MGVLDFRPHSLYYEETTEGYYDDEGDYHPGSSEWKFCCRCGAQPPARENSQLQIPDGRIEVFDLTLTMPAEVRYFEYGERVRMKMFNDPEKTYTVVGFDRYQHFSKLYVKNFGGR